VDAEPSDETVMTRGAAGHVLMVVENNPYPQDGRVRREATSLARAGYTVIVIAPSSGDQPWREVIEGVSTYRYPRPPGGQGFLSYVVEYGYSLVAALALSIYVFARHRFNVVHTHNPPDLLALIALLYRPLGCRFVFDHHDLSPDLYMARFGADANPRVFRALSRLQRWALRSADGVIATNDSYAAVAVEEARVPPARVTVVRNGPDLSRVRTMPVDSGLRQAAPIILGYVGAMNRQDGLDYLLRALAHLRASRSDFMCVLIGDGDAVADLRRDTERLGLSDHVRFTGRQDGDDLMTLLSTADICVDPDPSNRYNDRSTMIKMTEYMALGKPIVAFDLPEHRVTAGDAAVYARPNDEGDFASCIAQLMDDPDRRERMGALGKARVESELSWHRQERHLLAAYDKLLGDVHPARDRADEGTRWL
jgi:glycosyltransferase involved in cell wall biosynthesis